MTPIENKLSKRLQVFMELIFELEKQGFVALRNDHYAYDTINAMICFRNPYGHSIEITVNNEGFINIDYTDFNINHHSPRQYQIVAGAMAYLHSLMSGKQYVQAVHDPGHPNTFPKVETGHKKFDARVSTILLAVRKILEEEVGLTSQKIEELTSKIIKEVMKTATDLFSTDEKPFGTSHIVIPPSNTHSVSPPANHHGVFGNYIEPKNINDPSVSHPFDMRGGYEIRQEGTGYAGKPDQMQKAADICDFQYSINLNPVEIEQRRDDVYNSNRYSTKTYEEIFEQDGKWVNGLETLIGIVEAFKTCDIRAEVDGNTLKFILSFTLEDHWSKTLNRPKIDIATEIIRQAFNEYLGSNFFDSIHGGYYLPSVEFLDYINQRLAQHKIDRQRKDYLMLWEIVARDFGLVHYPKLTW